MNNGLVTKIVNTFHCIKFPINPKFKPGRAKITMSKGNKRLFGI